MELLQYEAIESPVAQPRATDMDLVEASYAAKDHESYDKILVLMRHGEAKHNVFEREYARTNGTPREEANKDKDYPVDPMLTGKVGYLCMLSAYDDMHLVSCRVNDLNTGTQSFLLSSIGMWSNARCLQANCYLL